MKSHSRYGFPVDAWSLGCVINVSFLGPQTLKVIFDLQPMTHSYRTDDYVRAVPQKMGMKSCFLGPKMPQ